jgi:Fe-S cluster assembly scaffold protein SufB
VTAPASPAKPRPARRAPTDLSFHLDPAYVEALAAREPDWSAADRRAALERFDALPIETNRLYTTYIDLRAAALEDVRPYDSVATTPAGVLPLPPDVAAFASFEEDGILGIELDPAIARAGVTLESLGALIARDPATAERLLADDASLPADDKLAQLTRAGWNQGVVLRIPAGVVVKDPIFLRWAVGAADRALLTRTIIELGDGASASVVEELVASGSTAAARQALFTGTTEVILGAGSKLALAGVQELGPDTVAFQHRRARIGEGADLRWALAQLGSRLVRSRIDNRLEGDRSTVDQVEIVFGSDAQLFDLTSFTSHLARDTTGNLLSKGALLDSARSYMKGLIIIDKPAIGTDSFLGEFGMNLSKAARSVAIPSLEIDQPDCRRAMHSSSVGPIDENQLFYLESRGIPPDEARKFIVLGFLEPVVARVPLAAAQDRLRDALEAKWAAGTASAGAAA